MKAPRYRKDQILFEDKVASGKLQIIKNKEQFFWHIIGKNNKFICNPETFKNLQGCINNLKVAENIFTEISSTEYIAKELGIKI